MEMIDTSRNVTPQNHQEVNNVQPVSTGTQEVQEVIITQVKPVVTNYSQEVLDYQGRANGFYTYAAGWNIWIASIALILNMLFAIKNDDPTLLAPEQFNPQVEQLAPSVEQPAPSVEQPAPSVEQPAPSVEQPAPSVEQPAPSVEQPAPSVEQPVII
jgi:hypothetical protein